jgi:hypothetical protein
MAKPSHISERDLQQSVRRLFHNHQYILVNTFVFTWESDFFSVTKSGNVYEVEMKVSKADYKKDFEKDKHLLFRSNMQGKTHHIFQSSGRYLWDKERIIGTYTDPGISWQHREGYYWDYKTGRYITGYGAALFRPQVAELRAPCTKIDIKPLQDILCPNRFYYACPAGIISVNDLPPYAGLIHATDKNDAVIIKQAPFIHKRPLLGGPLTSILLDKFWYLSQHQRYHLQVNDISYKDSYEGNGEPKNKDVF